MMMTFPFATSLATFSLALGLAGSALVALPGTAALAEPASNVAVASQDSQVASLKGGRVTVEAGSIAARRLPLVDADNNPLSYRFQGRPLEWVTLEDNIVVFNAPADQTPGVHRVTVRVTNAKGQRAYVKYIVTILPAQSK